jgi:cytosine deaminase
MRRCFDMVTEANARIMGLEGYGLAPGCQASLVVLDADDPVEALRLRAARLAVVSKGRVVAETARGDARLDLPGRPASVRRRMGGQGRAVNAAGGAAPRASGAGLPPEVSGQG